MRAGKVIIADPAAPIALTSADEFADLRVTIEIPDVVYFEAARNEKGAPVVAWCNRHSRFVPTHIGIEYIRGLGEHPMPSEMEIQATLETLALFSARHLQVKVFLLVEKLERRREFLDEHTTFVTLDDLRAEATNVALAEVREDSDPTLKPFLLATARRTLKRTARTGSKIARARPETTPVRELVEEHPPADAPVGTRAFRTVFNGFVYSGTVSRFAMNRKAFSLGGSDITVRKAAFFGEPSHFLVPPSVSSPYSTLSPSRSMRP